MTFRYTLEERHVSGPIEIRFRRAARPQRGSREAVVSTPGQKVTYIRVSSKDQNLQRQREALAGIGAAREFTDHISARTRAGRPGLEACIDYVREGDELHVASIDRLARSLIDLKQLVSELTEKGVSVHFHKENLTFSAANVDPMADLMLGILGAFAEFERTIIRERQAEGIALAKKAGKFRGRSPALTPEQVEEARQRIAHGETKRSIASGFGVARSTLDRAIKAAESH